MWWWRYKTNTNWYANKEIPSNMNMVNKFLTNASGATWWPIFSQCNWCPLVAEFPTNACGATCWVNLLAIRYLQLWCQLMGPLCLWKCFKIYFIGDTLPLASIWRAVRMGRYHYIITLILQKGWLLNLSRLFRLSPPFSDFPPFQLSSSNSHWIITSWPLTY